MEQDAIVDYVKRTFADTTVLRPTDGPGAGDTFFVPTDDPKQFPFATIVAKNYGDFDNTSQLDRQGIFRLNVGVRRDTFRGLFPDDSTVHDPTVLDVLMPHPVYASQSWISVLNPSAATFQSIEPLLAEAHDIAVARLARGRS